MGVKIFFARNNEVIQLPVNPEEITVSREGNNQKREVVNLGEINVLKLARLCSMSISCFLPFRWGDPYICVSQKNFKYPAEIVKFFEDARDSFEPVLCKIVGDHINDQKALMFAVDNFNNKYEGGDEDTWYTLDLVQFKNYGAKKFDTDFATPVDEEGNVKASTKNSRLKNAALATENAVKKTVNAAKQVQRNVEAVEGAVGTILTAGTIVGI